MIRSLTIGLALAALLAPEAPGQARDSSVLEPGTRVQFRLFPDQPSDAGERQRYEGTLVAFANDTLFVRLHRGLGVLAVPRLWVDELRISQGLGSRWGSAWRAGRMGFLLGAGLGAVVGSELANTRDESGSAVLETILSHAALYGLSISISGAFWGLFHPSERWKRVNLALLSSDSRGLRVGVSLGL
jgi:hypothetical protein